MPILLSISVLALVALLWAAVSAAQHIRRARRRRRRSLSVEAAEPGRIGLNVSAKADAPEEVTFKEITPYMEAVIARPSSARMPAVKLDAPEPAFVSTPAYVPKLSYARKPPSVSAADQPVAASVPVAKAEEAAPPPTVELSPPSVTKAVAEPIEKIVVPPAEGSGFFSTQQLQLRNSSAERKAFSEVPPPPADPFAGFAAVAKAVRVAAEARAEDPSVVRPVLGKHAVAGKLERPDWAYFNRDMGDLSDPYQAPRRSSKVTPGDSRR